MNNKVVGAFLTLLVSCSLSVQANAQGYAYSSGDVNQDGVVNMADALGILNYLFAESTGETVGDSGLTIQQMIGGCRAAADVKNDNRIDLGDALHLLFNQFQPNEDGLHDLPEPTGTDDDGRLICGSPAEPSELGCESHTRCPEVQVVDPEPGDLEFSIMEIGTEYQPGDKIEIKAFAFHNNPESNATSVDITANCLSPTNSECSEYKLRISIESGENVIQKEFWYDDEGNFHQTNDHPRLSLSTGRIRIDLVDPETDEIVPTIVGKGMALCVAPGTPLYTTIPETKGLFDSIVIGEEIIAGTQMDTARANDQFFSNFVDRVVNDSDEAILTLNGTRIYKPLRNRITCYLSTLYAEDNSLAEWSVQFTQSEGAKVDFESYNLTSKAVDHGGTFKVGEAATFQLHMPTGSVGVYEIEKNSRLSGLGEDTLDLPIKLETQMVTLDDRDLQCTLPNVNSDRLFTRFLYFPNGVQAGDNEMIFTEGSIAYIMNHEQLTATCRGRTVLISAPSGIGIEGHLGFGFERGNILDPNFRPQIQRIVACLTDEGVGTNLRTVINRQGRISEVAGLWGSPKIYNIYALSELLGW